MTAFAAAAALLLASASAPPARAAEVYIGLEGSRASGPQTTLGLAAVLPEEVRRKETSTQVYSNTLLQLLAYEGVTSKQVTDYIAFLESKDGRYYVETIDAALEHALGGAAEELGVAIARIFTVGRE